MAEKRQESTQQAREDPCRARHLSLEGEQCREPLESLKSLKTGAMRKVGMCDDGVGLECGFQGESSSTGTIYHRDTPRAEESADPGSSTILKIKNVAEYFRIWESQQSATLELDAVSCSSQQEGTYKHKNEMKNINPPAVVATYMVLRGLSRLELFSA